VASWARISAAYWSARKIIRADREEFRLARKLRCHHRRGRYFHHDAGGNLATTASIQPSTIN
jgi:hypothetical protein